MAMLTKTVSCRFGETYSRLPLASSVDLIDAELDKAITKHNSSSVPHTRKHGHTDEITALGVESIR